MKPNKPTPGAKRGVAIESAVAAMMIAFALCFLLCNLALYSIRSRKAHYDASDRFLQADRAGEAYLSYLADHPDQPNAFSDPSFPGYTASTTTETGDGTSYFTSIRDADGEFCLYIESVYRDGALTVARWSYLSP